MGDPPALAYETLDDYVDEKLDDYAIRFAHSALTNKNLFCFPVFGLFVITWLISVGHEVLI